jgi:hypothetical protein
MAILIYYADIKRTVPAEEPQVRLRHVGNLLSEVWAFAWQNKAWWLVPTVVILLLLGVLIFSGQAVAPFIYTLF